MTHHTSYLKGSIGLREEELNQSLFAVIKKKGKKKQIQLVSVNTGEMKRDFNNSICQTSSTVNEWTRYTVG